MYGAKAGEQMAGLQARLDSLEERLTAVERASREVVVLGKKGDSLEKRLAVVEDEVGTKLDMTAKQQKAADKKSDAADSKEKAEAEQGKGKGK